MPDQCFILFDGDCNFCNRTVQFVYKRDKHAIFQFAPRQSQAAKSLLPEAAPSSIVLMVGDKTYYKSDATLQIARRLRFPWQLLYGFVIVPRPIRDAVYGWIAKNRHRFYGKPNTCNIKKP